MKNNIVLVHGTKVTQSIVDIGHDPAHAAFDTLRDHLLQWRIGEKSIWQATREIHVGRIFAARCGKPSRNFENAIIAGELDRRWRACGFTIVRVNIQILEQCVRDTRRRIETAEVVISIQFRTHARSIPQCNRRLVIAPANGQCELLGHHEVIHEIQAPCVAVGGDRRAFSIDKGTDPQALGAARQGIEIGEFDSRVEVRVAPVVTKPGNKVVLVLAKHAVENQLRVGAIRFLDPAAAVIDRGIGEDPRAR